ncbi:uncharacterized protein LOC135809299 [Sycon ciliatum]|uniref:uncharacterized protein LOC135809299 n=1 Tax=Sycon ciliatum TaxID=27933 RepID=UPI0031F6921C
MVALGCTLGSTRSGWKMLDVAPSIRCWMACMTMLCLHYCDTAAATSDGLVSSDMAVRQDLPHSSNTTTEGPSVPVFRWKVGDANGTCIQFRTSDIEFQFPGSSGPAAIEQVTSAKKLTELYGYPKVSGECSSSVAMLIVFWGAVDLPQNGWFNFTVVFHHRIEEGAWLATRFFHQENIGNPQYAYGGQDYFKAPLDQAFHCNQRTTHSLDGSATTSFDDLTVQAFFFASDDFSKEVVYCPANSDPRSSRDVVMIVAISAGSLLLLAIVACVIVRTINSNMKTTLEYESL